MVLIFLNHRGSQASKNVKLGVKIMRGVYLLHTVNLRLLRHAVFIKMAWRPYIHVLRVIVMVVVQIQERVIR